MAPSRYVMRSQHALVRGKGGNDLVVYVSGLTGAC